MKDMNGNMTYNVVNFPSLNQQLRLSGVDEKKVTFLQRSAARKANKANGNCRKIAQFNAIK